MYLRFCDKHVLVHLGGWFHETAPLKCVSGSISDLEIHYGGISDLETHFKVSQILKQIFSKIDFQGGISDLGI